MKIKMKNIYLLLTVVLSLIVLTLYSTYAMFTSSVSSGTAINLESNITYDFDINSTKTFTLEANTILHFNANINNTTAGAIKYGIYHNFNLASNSSVSIGEVVADATTTTTSPNSTGNLNASTSKTVPIAIKNNSGSTITVTIGLVTGYTSNTLTYGTGNYLITNTIDDDNIGNAACESSVNYNPETDCYQENIAGVLYDRCVITTGQTTLNNLDTSGANPPALADGMIPIYHNGTNWVKADVTNTNSTHKWYDYTNKLWANAVMVSSGTRTAYMSAAIGSIVQETDILAYYVWIPRYKYQLFNINCTSMSPAVINVTFQYGTGNKVTGITNSEWLTHPAFTFGDTELTGIWVGKFELSGSTSVPTVKPNLNSLVNNYSISAYHTTAKVIETSTYLTTTGISQINSHIIKNTEWGAVTYLSYSSYGLGTTPIGINNYSTTDGGDNTVLKTGCGAASDSSSSTICYSYNSSTGKLASTTGNITGIYDMSGGAWEYVMGVMKDSAGTGLMYFSSGFTSSTLPYGSPYIDQYAYGTTYSDQTAYSRRILGDATCETYGWYGDSAYFVYSSNPWFVRGYYYAGTTSAGLSAFSSQYGSSSWLAGTRTAISIIE